MPLCQLTEKSADIKTPGAPEESVEYIGYELDTPPLPQCFTKKLSTKLSILVSWLIAPLKKCILGYFLIPAHKGWGYSHPLHQPGGSGSGGHKACGCPTAKTNSWIFSKFSGFVYPMKI